MASAEDSKLEVKRRRLIEEIAAETADTASYTGRAALSARTLAALAKVPRHLFVPEFERIAAYVNRPLPIGRGQTISQPFIVALMTDFLELQGTERVLEIGTGCGYQTAVLAELAREVFTIERLDDLGEAARKRLGDLGYGNVQCRIGDGSLGWPEAAPFDAVLVTAAAAKIPDSLAAQLKPGGRLVIPVGTPYQAQELLLAVKEEDGRLAARRILPVAFVPLVGKGA